LGSLRRVSDNAEIRAITFDVGGTLIEPWPSVGDIYAEVAADFGLTSLSPAELNRAFVTAWRAKQDFDYSESAWLELVAATFDRPANELPSGFFDRLYARFTEPDAWRIFADVAPALEALAKLPVRLAVISNWDDRLRPLLATLDLARFFESATISCEAGFAKPAPEIFAAAAARLALPPNAILHVGDSRREDVEGARAAGFRTALVDRAGGGGDLDSLEAITALIGLGMVD
jgi:putative hydrolase of the HAD superfamily